ncbi:LicD family protein, partial [Candidatus Saccharibacteria bacterium]|nr:LicD family protein [Candidatus Saccharibacteria bacterium]
GFIPWDDDIDISMPRPDYDRLQAIIKSKGNCLAKNIYLHSYEQKNLHLPFTKVYDYSIRTEDERYKDKYAKHLWVDIFPIDGMPSTKAEATKVLKKIDTFKWLLATKKKTLSTLSGPFAKIRKATQRLILLPLPSRFLVKRMINLARRYDYAQSQNAGLIVWGNGPREYMPKTIFESYSTVKFMGDELKCYKDKAQYLSNLYDDYMKLPHKSKRVTHNIKAWRVNHEK